MIAASGARLQEPVFADAVTLLWRMPSGEETSLCASLAETDPRCGTGGGFGACLCAFLKKI